ncbi:hypothetical protein CEUSTIGMA_g3525.t1 [Chlamydomonas eustigma]|uniref:Aminotransferase class I/classII large domain-containing protein n=1 Tax=Chlamydomonas eustigma TaxID=1157962 RepID=A0A250WZN8_9CHLO|nr:hypothetical protein CEUSTIGMA_g3525.t1 [Chlamydomonas eustigma]|eukprot:GAX76082.1 hypothetical protein CEUSTIGMA_g3525.t1 [Chlamydomonas eustigma]
MFRSAVHIKGYYRQHALQFLPCRISRSVHVSSALVKCFETESCTTQISEYASREVTSAIIDFSVGQPSPRLLPIERIRKATSDRLAESTSNLLLQYGPRQGYPSFRKELASFLNQRYLGHVVTPDSLMTTAGVSHGLDLVCGCLAKPGDIILVEQPTYFLAKRIFECNNLNVESVKTDASGLDTEALEEMLEAWPAHVRRPRLLYTIPVHNNPSATTLPPARRLHLIQLAHKFDLTIIADEVYQMLSFLGSEECPVPPLRHFESIYMQGNNKSQHCPSKVVSLGSFSKILAPGLRLGWVEAGQEAMEKLRSDGVINSGGCIAPLSCGIAHSLLQMGSLQEHLDACVRPALEAQCLALSTAIHEVLPAATFLHPQGGYFLWLQLPEKVRDARELLKHAEKNGLGVKFTPGEACGGDANFARLCFAFYSPSELTEGARRLALAVSTFPTALNDSTQD